MTPDEMMFFDGHSAVLPLYQILGKRRHSRP